ncbi:hypothetical protein G7Y89_g8267 [Cudoniella acicularis]|uniref:Uncharacterized protein n=1 Tax=Cudoniella acicularis TaxID=354080 RepID=A0A8H4W186_9HELO|nr:hypothetical protein G7Y89_g8267 [Cudoniella acicularis]
MSSNSTSNSTGPPQMKQLSANSDFHFEILRPLEAAVFGGDVGEILIAADQIESGNFESYRNAFYALADRVFTRAESIDMIRFPASAHDAWTWSAYATTGTNIGFIPEWEKVITPIVDYLFTLPAVDTSAIALLGLSFSGYLAPRAATFEHHLAATLAIDGILDFPNMILPQFGSEMIELVKSGNQETVNDIVNKVLAEPDTPTKIGASNPFLCYFPPKSLFQMWLFDQGFWAFKATTPFELFNQSLAYNSTDVIDQMSCPVFVADAKDDMFLKGAQSVQ